MLLLSANMMMVATIATGPLGAMSSVNILGGENIIVELESLSIEVDTGGSQEVEGSVASETITL